MPGRILFMFLAVAGLAVLVALLARGWDAQQAAESGPRWRRQLVCAALFLLACLGCSSSDKLTPPTEATAPVVAGQPLEETAQWQFVTATWREADEVASGKRGDYPFDRKGQEALLKAIQEAAAIVNKLAAAGTLSGPEAGLLTSGFTLLSEGVSSKRTTEVLHVKCYDMMMVAPAVESLNRLRARLPLLKKLAAGGTIRRAVLEKVLPSIESDLKILKSTDEAKRLDPKVQAEAEGVWEESEAALGKIKELLKGNPRSTLSPAELRKQALEPVKAGQPLEETPQWQFVTATWREADEVASGKRGDYPFDDKSKKHLLATIQEATSVIGKLSAAGTLSAPEAQLLTKDLGTLEAGVQFKRPTELRNATCYEPMPLPLPAGESLKRLRVRLPLLQKLATEGKVHRAALERVLPSIEADLKTLTSSEELKRLDPQGQTEAGKIRQEGEASLGEIKKLLDAKK